MLQLWRAVLEDLGLLLLLEGKSKKKRTKRQSLSLDSHVISLQAIESRPKDLRASSAKEKLIRFSENLTFHS